MYPEVHFPMEANLRWSGVEAQCSPNSPMAHRILLVLSPMQDATIHYGTLEGGHRTRTSLGQSPQLNWRLPSNCHQWLRHQGLELEESPQLNWRPQVIHTPTTQINRLGFKEPKGKRLLTFHPTESSPRTQTDATDAMARTQVLKSFTPKFQQSYKSYWGNKRGRTKRKSTKDPQDQDPTSSPHREEKVIGGNVDLDLLFLFPQRNASLVGGIGRNQGS